MTESVYNFNTHSMLAKHVVISQILSCGVVAIVRIRKSNDALKVVHACMEGGINTVEITFTVDKAHAIIETVAANTPQCIIGAGTVLDSETARVAILSGARYIVSPHFDERVAKLCNRYAVPYMAGCFTPKEIMEAMEHGVEIIKLFPGIAFNPSMVRALNAPLPQANIMPTGGVSIDNAASWIHAGAVALGVGGDLTKDVEQGGYDTVISTARRYVDIVKRTRQEIKLHEYNTKVQFL